MERSRDNDRTADYERKRNIVVMKQNDSFRYGSHVNGWLSRVLRDMLAPTKQNKIEETPIMCTYRCTDTHNQLLNAVTFEAKNANKEIKTLEIYLFRL